MSLQYQSTSIPLWGPLDQATDEHALAVGGMARAENLDYGKRGIVRARRGYRKLSDFYQLHSVAQSLGRRNAETAIGTGPGMLWTAGQDLWRTINGSPYHYAMDTDRWYASVGSVNPYQLDVTSGPDDATGVRYGSCASNGTHRIWAWSMAGNTGVAWSVETMEGEEIFRSFITIAAAAYRSVLPVAWPNGGALGFVVCAGGTVTFYRVDPITGLDAFAPVAPAATQLANDAQASAGALRYVPMDVMVIPGSSWAIVAYTGATASTVRWVRFGQDGGLASAVTTETASGTPRAVAVGGRSDGAFAIAWTTNNATNSVQARSYSVAGAALHAVVNVDTGSGAVEVWGSVACTWAASDSNRLVVTWSPSFLVDFTGGDTLASRCNTVNTSTGAVGSLSDIGFDFIVRSDIDDQLRFWVRFEGVSATVPAQMVLLQLQLSSTGNATCDRVPRGHCLIDATDETFWELRPRMYDGSVAAMKATVGSGDPLMERIRYLQTDQKTVTFAAVGGLTTAIGGGIVNGCDGRSVVSQGFLQYPPTPTGVGAPGSGSIANGTYGYLLTIERHDSRGQTIYSTFDSVFGITLSGLNDTVTLTGRSLQLGSGNGEYYRVWRSIDGAGATGPWYLVSGLDPSTTTGANRWVSNDPTSRTFTFQDDLPDAQIITRPQFRNPAIEPLHVPPASIVMVAKGRQWLAGGGDMPQRVRASKLLEPTIAPEHNDAIFVDCRAPVTGLARMADFIVVFTEEGIELIAGDGPGNDGSGSFSQPQVLAADDGCVSPVSVVETPLGVFFQNRSGIHLLTQALSVAWIGEGVDDFGTDTIHSAFMVPELKQVRFVQDERTLVYDYDAGRWSVYTIGGDHAVTWSGGYSILASDARVLVETEGLYTDAGQPFKMVGITGAYRSAGAIEKMMRLRRVLIRGRWKSPHILRVGIGYSGEDGWDKATWVQHMDDVVDAIWPDGQAASVKQPVAALSHGYGNGSYGGGFGTAGEMPDSMLHGGQPWMARASRYVNRRCTGFRFMFEATVSDEVPVVDPFWFPNIIDGPDWLALTERGRMVELYDITAEFAEMPTVARLRPGRNL